VTICLFKRLVGRPCPGCGLTRASLSALRGDWRGAFRWHPLFWLPPAAGLAFAASAIWPRLRPAIRSKRLGYPALAAFLGLWLARLAFNLPGVASRRW
jgi:hypothetical protein